MNDYLNDNWAATSEKVSWNILSPHTNSIIRGFVLCYSSDSIGGQRLCGCLG